MKYIVVHCKHEGCYEGKVVEDQETQLRAISIRINPPKLFAFDDRDSASEFMEDYMNDIDCIDLKCRKNGDVEHVENCTCGIVELDEEGIPILFYNKTHQIFLTEVGCHVFEPPRELKHDIFNLNLTNKLIRRCKKMSREQRNQYIELGKMCQDCELSAVERDKEREKAAAAAAAAAVENTVISPPPAPTPVVAPAAEKKPKKGYIKKADRVP
jgi:hypothetical protein